MLVHEEEERRVKFRLTPVTHGTGPSRSRVWAETPIASARSASICTVAGYQPTDAALPTCWCLYSP
jgi:hypothetical protein